MWDLRVRNRGVFVLISVLSGCTLLYNAWGAILALTVSIIVVIYVCYSLLTNDSILSPQALFIGEYFKEGGRELGDNIVALSDRVSKAVRKLSILLTSHYRNYVGEKMSRFRRNGYQLSNDARQNSTTSSWSDLTANQLSPIPKKEFQENLTHSVARRIDRNYPTAKITSTPIGTWRKESSNAASSNGGIGLFTPARPLRQETQLPYGTNHTSRANETVFSPEGSPWGTSISPKIRSKAAGVQTVQTVAGPLLASTRYNIDPKVYSDITSPGLSTRLAKYATEANNKLTHQSQYSTGQFPKVNLSVSPLPLISPKNSKVRTPVTVRIAPPEASRYSPPERQKIISEVCRTENRAPPTAAQVLKEISLKRHASREDVSSDLVKKQRTESLYEKKLEDVEEMTQKRGREDSPVEPEEEVVSNSSQSRPIKKTKTPSCFDILNSLSSSTQYSSGIKRKASTLDLSRSGTPDIEKHFKASDVAPAVAKISVKVSQPQAETKGLPKNNLSKDSSPSVDIEMSEKSQEQLTTRVKGILKGASGKDAAADENQDQIIERHAKVEEKKESQNKKNSPPAIKKPVNFTEKLFMKAEPETNERLRTLIEEQGNIRAKFTTDDVDEIKKEDIVSMRQNSMKARLQSMFDAISGKSKKINPDVIIHAEAASEPDAAPETPASQATLNSTTLTTSVNTSPITTSGVAPAVTSPKLGDAAGKKRVTFNIPSSTNPISSTESKPSVSEAQKQQEAPKTLLESFIERTNSALDTSNNFIPLPGTKTSIVPGAPNEIAYRMPLPGMEGITKVTVAASPPPAFTATTSSIQKTTLPSSSSDPGANTSLDSTVPPYSAPPPFTASNITSVPQNVTQVPKLLPAFGTPSLPTLVPSSGSQSSELNKLQQSVKPGAQTTPPMSGFSFGVSKMSSVSTFGASVQPSATNFQSQITTSNSGAPIPATSSTTSSNDMRTQQLSTGSGATAPATATPAFTFGGSSTAPQSTNTGGFSFTTNIVANKSQAPPAFGNATTPAFGNAAAPAPGPQTQGQPLFGSQNGFQSSQIPATTPAHSAPSFGNNPPAFNTSVTTTAAQQISSFGNTPSSNAQSFFGANAATTGATFAFGNTPTQTTAAIAFGTNVNSTATPTNSTFSFGSSSTTNVKPAFSFGANTPTTTASGSGTSGQIPAFGNATGNAVPVFGTPSTTAPPAFGAPANTAAPVFSAPTTTPSAFGISSSIANPGLFGSPATTTGSGMFNATASQPTFGAAASSAAPSGFGTPKTTAPPAFGTQTSETTFSYGGASTGRNSLFPNAGMNPPTNTAASNGATATSTPSTTFGGNAAPKNLFNQTKPPPSFAASTAAGFGNTATPVFGTQNPSFGATGNAAVTGNSGFGTANTASPVFGAQKQNPTGPPPAFGSTNSTFGTNTAAPSGFESSATTFGAQNTTTPSFGNTAGPSAPAFGANASTTPFGGQNQAPPPAFGAQNSTTPNFGAQNSTTPNFGATNNNPTPSFGFAGNQGQIQQNPGFSFTGNAAANNATTTTTTSPFQFGGTPAKSEGFNFSAATTTPNLNFGSTTSTSFGTATQGTNMFGAAQSAIPSGGMFSIGAGSTAPSRSRSTRGPRRQK